MMLGRTHFQTNLWQGGNLRRIPFSFYKEENLILNNLTADSRRIWLLWITGARLAKYC